MVDDYNRSWPSPPPGCRQELERRLLAGWRAEKPWFWLRPLGALYGWGAGLRRRLYGGLLKPARAEKPVVSVGNLTVGGSGKTPLCLALARQLLERGHKPAVISRGYGRSCARQPHPLVVSRGQGPEISQGLSGDEPWLMASQLPGLRVVVDSDRARAARTAVRRLEADLLILDDGFQHLALAADVRILMIPAHDPFGNGAVLPAGPLREPLKHQRLADILISSGSSRPAPEVLEMAGGRPVFAAEYRAVGWRPLGGGDLKPSDFLVGRRVCAFCGLGRPDSFQRSLLGLGVDLRRLLAFRDHQVYDRPILDGLGLSFLASGAEFLVTTAKDAVKLPPDFPLPVMVLEMEMSVTGPEPLADTILRRLDRSRPTPG